MKENGFIASSTAWSPDGKQFTIDSAIFSKDGTLDSGGISLVEMDVVDSSSVWKNISVEKILKSKEPKNADKSRTKNPAPETRQMPPSIKKEANNFLTSCFY